MKGGDRKLFILCTYMLLLNKIQATKCLGKTMEQVTLIQTMMRITSWVYLKNLLLCKFRGSQTNLHVSPDREQHYFNSQTNDVTGKYGVMYVLEYRNNQGLFTEHWTRVKISKFGKGREKLPNTLLRRQKTWLKTKNHLFFAQNII